MVIERSEETETSGLGLRTKFILSFVALTAMIAVLIISFVQWRVKRTILDQTNDLGLAIGNTVEATASYYVLFGLTDDLKKISDELARTTQVEYADFVGADGRVLAASGPKPPPVVARQPLGRRRFVDRAAHLFIIPFYESRADSESLTSKPKGYFRLVVSEEEARNAASSVLRANLAITAVVIGIASLLAIAAARFFARPVLELVESAKRIAEGDLTHRSEVVSRDEIGMLAAAFNRMAGTLETTIKGLAASQSRLKSVMETVGSRSRTVLDRVDEQRAVVDETSESIDSLNLGIRKITGNVESLSASSEETSSSMLEMVASMEEVNRHTDTLWGSVEETASAAQQMVSSIHEVDKSIAYLTNFVTETSTSMVQMSASIGQVETNAARSYDLAVTVADAAETGMKAVRETIEGMEQIRQAVHQSNSVVSRLGDRSIAIGKILNVIDDIAEQTNLLALNAAILAAQAGEYGKGFSVVAAEIRDLSERTASSTRDITTLIRAVQEEVRNALKAMSSGSQLVEQGVSLSHDAGKVLTRILDSATKAAEMGKEIASATREQAKGSEEMAHSVERLQEMTRQISSATAQQNQGSQHILRAVESMREVTKYVRQAMVEQKSGSVMISSAAERMIEMIHEIFQAAANQTTESEKIVATMDQLRMIADGNRSSAADVSETIAHLDDTIRNLDVEVRKFRVH